MFLEIEKLKSRDSGERCFEIDFLKSVNSGKTQNRKIKKSRFWEICPRIEKLKNVNFRRI